MEGHGEPIGLMVTRVARALSRSFDEALGDAGATLPVWVVLASLQGGAHGSQKDLAQTVGIEGATLTHHLSRLEASGLVTRERDPADRRAHKVALTVAGQELFGRLLERVIAFDAQLRGGFSDRDLATLRRLLNRLLDNAVSEADGGGTG